jgi:FAD/FMN-containing dehydrogenase
MLTKSAVQEFIKGLHGRVIQHDDEGYEEARKVWNGLIDKRPALIAQCSDENDVVHSVNFARNNDLLVAVRGGGHNVAGFGTCDDGIVIDLSSMKDIIVDTASKTVKAQGGATWGDFDKVTQALALSTTGGLVTTTGIGGFTLGGGIGWLVRKYGLAIDNLLEVEMITADGERLTASEKENSDLFWGVRGGGGNFGIVTTFTYRLYPVGPNVYGGAVFYPVTKAKELLHFYSEWAKKEPDELTSMIAFLTAPPAPFIPQHLQGTSMIAFALCYTGGLEQAEEIIKPLRDFATPSVDLLGPVPYVALQGMFDATVPKGILSYWKAEYINELNDTAIDTLVEQAGKMGAPFVQVHIHHIEGAVSKIKADVTAFGHRDSPFILNIIGMWVDPTEKEKHIAWVRGFSNAMRTFSTGYSYLNFMGDEGESRIKAAYGEEKYARLVWLKNKYDPKNLFRLNQNIKPSK